MFNRNNLRATALFTLLLITEAVYASPIRETKRLMKPLVHKALKDLQNESLCKHKDSKVVHTVGCLAELKNNASDCELVSILGTYFTQATDLKFQKLLHEPLQIIDQYLQSLRKELCKSKAEVKHCGLAFKKSDGDYEKICKVTSLLEHLSHWLFS